MCCVQVCGVCRCVVCGGGVAGGRVVKALTANRKVAGSNPTIAIGDFLSPRS